jgi:hypothetical protein
MQTVRQFQTPEDFWNGMLLPDYNDFQADVGDLRMAFHSAISLFHMHDWVFNIHEDYIIANFTLIDDQGNTPRTKKAKHFGNALEAICPDFALIRGIANAGKHLALSNIRPHPDAPSHSSNTASQSLGFGEGSYGIGPYGGGPQVMLEGANGHLHFSEIAKSVYNMWVSLKDEHGW